jgi:signal transduction histidine kinase
MNFITYKERWEMIKKKPFGYSINPLLLFIKTLGVIFLVEFFVMFFISLLPDLSLPLQAFLDALILSAFVVPALYFLFFQPIQKTLIDKAKTETQRAELEKMDKIKSEFISIAAHELRTPVATIMGYTELLSDPGMINTFNENQRRDFLSSIYESTERLDKIVDDILDVSRIESGQRIPLNKKSLSITTLIEKVLNRLNLKSDHNLTFEVRPEVPERLNFDEHRIEQVIENLLSNAIKYSPRQSPITIVVEADDHRCSVTITDQGIGMSDEQKDRIYDKFYRADTSDTAAPGLGLGMSIVKQIIDDHDGTITIDSKLNRGTRVCFTLPR